MARNDKNVSNWVGWVFFAGFMMIILGFFQAIAGLTALINNKFLLVSEKGLLVFNFTAWGWIHLVLGVIVLIAGFSVMSGSRWARVVGVLVAGVSLVANMASVNSYPVWSIIIMIVDVVVIYALTVHGGELSD